MKKILIVLSLVLLPSLSWSATCVEPAECTWSQIDSVTADVYSWAFCNPGTPAAPPAPECIFVPSSYNTTTTGAWSDIDGYCSATTISYTSSCEVPEPEDPPHCDNYVKDGDESGIDCGGSCAAVCEDGCEPPGVLTVVVGGSPVMQCYNTTPPNSYGDCPPGSSLVNAGLSGETCSSYSPPTSMAPGTVLPDFVPPTFPGPVETSTSTPAPVVVVNPDNTTSSTSTSTTTTTNSDDSTTTGTETTTTVTDTTTGDILSTTIVNNYPPGEGDDAGVIAAVNSARINITDKLQESNDLLTTIEENTSDLTQELGTEETDIYSALDASIAAKLAEQDTALTGLSDEIVSDAGDGKTFLVSESISSAIESVFPSPQSCTSGYQVTIDGHTMTIDCMYFDGVRVLFAWILGVLSLYMIYQTLFKPIGA